MSLPSRVTTPAGGLEQPGQAAEQRGLAAGVGAHDHGHFALGDLRRRALPPLCAGSYLSVRSLALRTAMSGILSVGRDQQPQQERGTEGAGDDADREDGSVQEDGGDVGGEEVGGQHDQRAGEGRRREAGFARRSGGRWVRRGKRRTRPGRRRRSRRRRVRRRISTSPSRAAKLTLMPSPAAASSPSSRMRSGPDRAMTAGSRTSRETARTPARSQVAEFREPLSQTRASAAVRMSARVMRKLTTAWSAAAMPTPARMSRLPAALPRFPPPEPSDPPREIA